MSDFTVWAEDKNGHRGIVLGGLSQHDADLLAATITDMFGFAAWVEEG